MFLRQTMAWTVFLQSDLYVKQLIRKRMNISDKDEIPTRLLVPASVFVAFMNTCLVMPFDCVKTHLEKVNPSETYINTFRIIYRQSGMLGFFTGFRLRFLLYFHPRAPN